MSVESPLSYPLSRTTRAHTPWPGPFPTDCKSYALWCPTMPSGRPARCSTKLLAPINFLRDCHIAAAEGGMRRQLLRYHKLLKRGRHGRRWLKLPGKHVPLLQGALPCSCQCARCDLVRMCSTAAPPLTCVSGINTNTSACGTHPRGRRHCV